MKQINPVTEVRHHQNESIDVQMNHLFVQSYRTQRRRTLLSLQKSQLLNYYFCLACIRIPLRVESVAMILPISLPVFCEPYLFLILKKNYIISLHLFPSRTTTSHLSHRSLFIYLMSNQEELENAVNEYITYWNQKRIKLSLGGLSPVEYRTEYQKAG